MLRTYLHRSSVHRYEAAVLLPGATAGEPKAIEQVSINLFRRDKVCYYSQQRSGAQM